MAETTPRQTARNNPALARVKAAMNGPIYAKVKDAWDAGGRDAARAVLAGYFRDTPEARRCLAEMFDGGPG